MADAGLIGLTQGEAPATVPSGLVRLYAKNDKRLYWKDAAGNERQIIYADTPEMFLLHRNSVDLNNLPDNTWVPLPFTHASIDTKVGFRSGSGDYQIQTSGYYLVTAGATFKNTQAGGWVALRISSNGNQMGIFRNGIPADGMYISTSVYILGNFTAGDVLTVEVKQRGDTGNNTNVYGNGADTSFFATEIG